MNFPWPDAIGHGVLFDMEAEIGFGRCWRGRSHQLADGIEKGPDGIPRGRVRSAPLARRRPRPRPRSRALAPPARFQQKPQLSRKGGRKEVGTNFFHYSELAHVAVVQKLCSDPIRLRIGCWMLDVGCWMLDVGCWMLDVSRVEGRPRAERTTVTQNLICAPRLLQDTC